ncbi:alpha-hydroxy-acid oxidizing protein [Nocardioides dongxiaopingii]|uniref:alpha-hydroxy acid oxidase n=1 Tax=Nocardioides sp. S-1144 TaxID=2582905 RepID=UPI00110F3126|nr:alpha-hydroxy acid oxidase [Nocardioides sp. S-1144]QCW50414.1 alpha-hydroxy-acid oxidizing protein [Nocardioides sp. S-1144]
MTDARWVSELEELARARLSPPLFAYLAQGARDGRTASRAVEAWRDVVLHPHVLRDVTEVDTSVELLGRRHPTPVGVAPSTLQRVVHPDGELAMARAVAASDGLVVVSSNAGTPFAEIGATGVTWWVQCYLPEDRSLAVPLLRRAVDAGASAVVLTADTPVVGTKYPGSPEADVIWDVVDPAVLRVNFDPGYESAPGAGKARDLGVRDMEWLGSLIGLPVVVKGVLRPDDADRVVEAGAAAVWVSNHGGRQLDRAPATAAVLPAVRAVVAGRAQVYVDGGVRDGLDVLTALALGADAVFLGRLPLYALVDGEPGVRRMLAEMTAQTTESMRLAGARDVGDTRDLTGP